MRFRAIQTLIVLASIALPWLLSSCQSPVTRTTTTKMGIMGQETTVVETPYEKPWDRELAKAASALQQLTFE